jgi:hypothetical protein
MSAIGPKRTWRLRCEMSAFGGTLSLHRVFVERRINSRTSLKISPGGTFHEAIHGPARNDHAFNAAVTAWQLCDWVFADITPAQQDKLNIHSIENMRSHARHHCRALHLCRQVATASKHMRVSRFPDPNVKTITTVNAIPPPPQGPPLHVAPGWFLYFDDDGEVTEAEDVFTDAYYFWTQFIYRNKIAEDEAP